MANKLVTSWAKNVDRVPKKYAMPPHKRPSEVVSIGNHIPVVDLSKDSGLVQEILEASQEFGLFQIINHGISERLMDETMDLFKELFDISFEDREHFFSEMSNKNCKVYANGYHSDEEVKYWNDLVIQPVFPIETLRQRPWIDKPARYREVVVSYSEEMRSLGKRILELIGEGLGLEKGYFGNKDLSKVQVLGVNHYPPCPDPSSAMGTPPHCDANLITFLQQQLYGLQIFKDGHWIGVQPLPYAFVVHIGFMLQVISNNKLVACEHRAVTNIESGRTSIGTFLAPSEDCIVEPAEALVVNNGAVFRGFKYKEFIDDYEANKFSTKILDSYKLQP